MNQDMTPIRGWRRLAAWVIVEAIGLAIMLAFIFAAVYVFGDVLEALVR